MSNFIQNIDFKKRTQNKNDMKKNENIITFLGNPMTILGDMIEKGSKAPDFTALNNDLQPVSLHNFSGKTLIISAMPSVDTGVCAAQTRRFNKEAADLGDVAIITISMDLPFALKRFCGAEGIDKAQTLSDFKNKDFANQYGFLIEELGLLARGVVVVDKNGIVQHVEYVKEVATEPNYEAALEVVKNII